MEGGGGPALAKHALGPVLRCRRLQLLGGPVGLGRLGVAPGPEPAQTKGGMGEDAENALVVGDARCRHGGQVDTEEGPERLLRLLVAAAVEMGLAFGPDEQPVLRPTGTSLGDEIADVVAFVPP